MSEVEQWLAACPPAALPTIEALRAVIRVAGPDLAETIKWNAPSFAHDGADRITLGLGREGSVRVVLHRGAARQDGAFTFADPARLAQWPSPDRGVLAFRDSAGVEACHPALVDLFSRWLEATR
jgi:hypothetical protein